jgi:Yippee zinc-binding/DNA-binding /Mis18, centromere assembly
MICGSVLGWKYVAAEEDSQQYKVGKFILETKRVLRGVYWENEDDTDEHVRELGGVVVSDGGSSSGGSFENGREDEQIEFDSQDEDECEDLFAGVWSPALARRRRRMRAWREGTE